MAKQATATNAMNIAFDQPGAGLQGYGIDQDNLAYNFNRLYQHRNEKAGGSKQVWEAIVKNAQRSITRSPNSKAAQEFQTFVKTGKLPTTMSRSFLQGAATHFDYGLREVGRSVQHKSNFLDSTFGKILHAIGTVALGAIPVVGPALAVAAGALNAGARTRPSGLGIGLGALSGYAGGVTGAGIASGINAAGGVGSYLGNAATSAGNFIQHPITGISNALGGGVSGGTAAGAASSAGGLIGGDAGAGPGTLVNSAGKAITGAGAKAAGGSLVSNIISAGNTVAPIVGAIIGGNAAKSAAKTQANAAAAASASSLATTREIIAAQEKATATARKDLEPWRLAGQKGLDLEKGLLGIGSKMTPDQIMKLDPGYKFRLGEGLKAIDASSAAARGPGLSGATLKELERYGSDYASNEFGNIYSRASNLSGQGLGAATGQANFTQAGAANNANATIAGTQAANEYNTQAANANAAGTVASGNAWGSAINTINQQLYLKQLLGP